MPAPVALLGSGSDHGGVIITGSMDVFIDGVPVAIVGSLHACPLPGHGVTTMFSSSFVCDSGMGLILVGESVAGCGAVPVYGAFNVVSS